MTEAPIDLRSDALAPPTDEMWEAMRAAPLGWATNAEDPSVNELQERVAALLGKEAGLWVPTCGMANLVALLTIPPRGSTVIEPGDRLYVLAPHADLPAVEDVFARWRRRV